jgi:hypothetical protein
MKSDYDDTDFDYEELSTYDEIKSLVFELLAAVLVSVLIGWGVIAIFFSELLT